MLQGTRFPVQVLKPCKSIQETSEKVLDFKARQLTSIEVQKAAEARNLTTISIDTLSVEVYEKQIFSSVLHPIREYMFRLSFLTTLNIYKDYFKGRQRLCKCEVKLCSCKLWLKTEFAQVHISFEEAAVFVHLMVLWPRSFVIFIVWWIEELCSQHLSQVGDQVAYWDPRIYWLVTY